VEGRLLLGVVNFPPRQIGPFMLVAPTLGVPSPDAGVVLIVPEGDVPIGAVVATRRRVRT